MCTFGNVNEFSLQRRHNIFNFTLTAPHYIAGKSRKTAEHLRQPTAYAFVKPVLCNFRRNLLNVYLFPLFFNLLEKFFEFS